MKYHHQFRFTISVERVDGFHASSGSLEPFTSPEIVFKAHHAPLGLADSDVMGISMWFRLLAISAFGV